MQARLGPLNVHANSPYITKINIYKTLKRNMAPLINIYAPIKGRKDSTKCAVFSCFADLFLSKLYSLLFSSWLQFRQRHCQIKSNMLI